MSDAAITIAGVVVGAVLAGAVSVAVTLISARSTADLDAKRRQHETSMAELALRQGRIERTYLHLLQVVNEAHEVMETDRVERQPPDYGAMTSRMNSVWAEMDAFGSADAHELFGSMRSAWLLFTIDMHNARVRAGDGPAERFDSEHLNKLREDARLATTALRAQVAAELRGEEGT